METALRFYELFKGLQITFLVRLLKKHYVLEQFQKEYNGRNLRYLARKYGYSERWIRVMMNEDKGD